MSPDGARAADYVGVFAHFGAEGVPERSMYLWSPVFPCLIAGRSAVIKRTRRKAEDASAVAAATRAWLAAGIDVVTPLDLSVANPVSHGDTNWVAYPFVEGRPYAGSTKEIEAAGSLLGRMHALSAGTIRLPAYRWLDDDEAREETDLELLRTVVTPHAPARVVDGLVDLVSGFVADFLPAIRDAQLPCANVCMDYKASNLVYTPAGPVLIDPDNGDFAPRLLDLAQAALLFHTDHDAAPDRPFDRPEWSAFLGAYLREVDLADDERRLWPKAIEFMLSLEGHWAFTGTPEDWHSNRQRSFLLTLASARPGDFPLTG